MSDIQLSISLRPSQFSRVVGQSTAVSLLQQMVAKSYFPRCILLSGPAGVGKTSLARLFAALVNCDSKVELEPCGTCYHCQSIFKSESSLVVEVDAASHRKVDDIDEVRKIVEYAVPEKCRRVIILDEFHCISDTAQESLLHILEAHSLDTTFVLTTTYLKGVEDAILSRSFPITLGDISIDDRIQLVSQYFTDFGVKVEEGVAAMVARAPHGLRSVWQYVDKLKVSFGDNTISLAQAQSTLGLMAGPLLEKVVLATKKSLISVIGTLTPVQKSGFLWNSFLEMLYDFAEDSVILHESGEVRLTSGVSEDFLTSMPWSKVDCMTFVNAYTDLVSMDWKAGIVKLYSIFQAAPAVGEIVGTTYTAPPVVASQAPTPVEMLNKDPVWALIGRSLGKRVVNVYI